jgi:hypothetical protein
MCVVQKKNCRPTLSFEPSSATAGEDLPPSSGDADDDC